MLERVLQSDKLAKGIIIQANITKSQFDTLLIDKLNRDFSLEQKCRLRDVPVSKGAFVRTLRQSQKNMEEALYTVIALEYFSILKEDDITNLLKIGRVLRQTKEQKVPEAQMRMIIKSISFTVRNISRSK